MAAGLDHDSGPLFIEALYESGTITSPVFALWLGDENQESYCDIGAIFDEAMRDPNDLVYLPALDG